jgi:hypothetical protein
LTKRDRGVAAGSALSPTANGAFVVVEVAESGAGDVASRSDLGEPEEIIGLSKKRFLTPFASLPLPFPSFLRVLRI